MRVDRRFLVIKNKNWNGKWPSLERMIISLLSFIVFINFIDQPFARSCESMEIHRDELNSLWPSNAESLNLRFFSKEKSNQIKWSIWSEQVNCDLIANESRHWQCYEPCDLRWSIEWIANCELCASSLVILALLSFNGFQWITSSISELSLAEEPFPPSGIVLSTHTISHVAVLKRPNWLLEMKR